VVWKNSRRPFHLEESYINSAADLKAFCGEHQGIVCTSSNAQEILEWSFAQREKILFFPDQHLGRNTAFNMGILLFQHQSPEPIHPSSAVH
jgi:quinolinate synthase